MVVHGLRFLVGKGAKAMWLSREHSLGGDIRVNGQCVLSDVVGLLRAIDAKPLAYSRPQPLRPCDKILFNTAVCEGEGERRETERERERERELARS